MSNLILGWRNQVMTGPVVTSGAASGAMQGDQLQNDQGNSAAAWQTRAGVTTGAILLAGRAIDTPWRAFGLFRTNLTAAATVTWNVLSGGVAVYAHAGSGPTPGFGQTVHVAAQDFVGDVMQVNISDPTNADGFLNIPLMYAGPCWQPRRNYTYQSVPSRTQQQARSASRAGGVTIRTDWVKRVFDLSLSGVQAAEVLPLLDDLDATTRRGGNVLFVPSPTSPDINSQALFGELEPASGITYPYSSGALRGWRATITERL